VAQPRGVQLDSTPVSAPVHVSSDPSALAHVLWELGVHAVDATPAGSRVGFDLSRAGPAVRLALTDGRYDAAPGALPGPQLELPMDPMQLRSTIERQVGRFSIEPAASAHGLCFVIELPMQALLPPPGASSSDAAGTHAPPAGPQA